MDDSILNSTKKILGVAEDYTVFDPDIATHINAAFSILHQLGLPADGFFIEDEDALWSEIPDIVPSQLHLIKTYVYLKVRYLFDPPTTSFLLTAMDNQIKEYEWRLNVSRENILIPPFPIVDPYLEEVVYDRDRPERRQRVYRALRH